MQVNTATVVKDPYEPFGIGFNPSPSMKIGVMNTIVTAQLIAQVKRGKWKSRDMNIDFVHSVFVTATEISPNTEIIAIPVLLVRPILLHIFSFFSGSKETARPAVR